MKSVSLAGRSVVIAGGDAREVVLARELKALGADIYLVGFSEHEEAAVSFLQDPPSVIDFLILPLTGVSANGEINAKFAKAGLNIAKFASALAPGALVLSGKMPDNFLSVNELTVIETANLDELAYLNAVPTAEGAVALAMNSSDITIHGSRSLVTGFGRCALPLARTLAALGSTVTIAARKREALAMAEALGFDAAHLCDLPTVAKDFDFLYNTVPAEILTKEVLENTKKDAIIIDIASAPGGTDFDAAKMLGRKSFLALGLPGKVAPVSAGQILAKVYAQLILIHKEGRRTHET